MEIPMGLVKFRISDKKLMRGEIQKNDDGTLLLFSGYNVYLKDEFKAMEGAHWMGYFDADTNPNPVKAWGVKDTQRNRFQLAYLMDMNPYAHYDSPLPTVFARRKKPDGSELLYNHQFDMKAHILFRRWSVIAGEMGVAKTLTAIEAMEDSKIIADYWLWVGPRSALDSVKYEFYKWQVCDVCGKLGMHHRYENHPIRDSKIIRPRFATYDEVKKIVTTWPSGAPAYRGVIFDECQKLKTWTAQRTQAAAHLTTAMRNEYKRDAIICAMSGTPAPKEPTDWWSICEVVCPGFLREGNVAKFKYRLALIKKYESSGGNFPKLETWWDDERKCKECGKFEDDPNHADINSLETWWHPYQKSINEIANLHKRLNGLVIVKLKKDCLDLPEKVFKRIICKPAANTLRAASLISKTARSAIQALTLNRELSDGFQYREVESGTETCPLCKGRLIIKTTVDLDDPENPLDSESLTRGHRAVWQQNEEATEWILAGYKSEPLRLGEQEIPCTQCDGSGNVPSYERTVVSVDCPKDDAVLNLLEEYEDEGRAIFWAGFTESVDRLVRLGLKAGWITVRLDGRGWWSSDPELNHMEGRQILEAFDDKIRYPKIQFAGQPGAGGVGLNLTASSMCCYYSNTFRGEDRAQSMDRIHRPGADHNRGCTIIDLIHLPQDIMVIDNLERKRNLESMTMGQMSIEMAKAEAEWSRVA